MRIAVVRLSAFGDIIQSMILVQFIKKRYPQSTLDWVIDSKFSEIARLNNQIDSVIEVRLSEIKKSKNLFHLIKHFAELRKVPTYDVVIDTQGLLKSAIISKIIPSIRTIGFDRKSARESLASFLYSRSFNIPYETNVIERYCLLISKALDINITKENILEKEAIYQIPKINLPKERLVSIIVGASFSSKIYPIENYRLIIEKLDSKFICLWGNNTEFKLAKKLSELNAKISISEKTTIAELLQIISSSSLVIGGDTGPTHLAWALNIPSITLFGSTPGYRNMYETKKNLKLESHTAVNPKKINKHDYSIADINPKDILKMAKELLKA